MYCSVISFANTKKEGETAVLVQHILAIQSKLKRSSMLKANVVYEVCPKYPSRLTFMCSFMSYSSRSGVNGPLRGINGFWSCRCAVSLFRYCHSVAHGLAQPNNNSIVSFGIGPRANGACMDSCVLEADADVGCGLPGRRVGCHEYVVPISLRRVP